jgi:hypothetical protein
MQTYLNVSGLKVTKISVNLPVVDEKSLLTSFTYIEGLYMYEKLKQIENYGNLPNENYQKCKKEEYKWETRN